MGHSFYSVYEHIVFSTKGRIDCLDEPTQAELFPYLAASCRNHGCQCLIAGGHSNHVHLLVLKTSTVLTAELVKELKRTSSKWLKSKSPAMGEFYWQSGYGAFSVSYSAFAQVRDYIASQKTHHAGMTWEQEFRAMLKKNGIAFDERYYLD